MASILDMTAAESLELYEFIQTLLGGEDIDVEITEKEIKILARKALKDYQYEINQWLIRNKFSNIVGFDSTIDFTNKFITDNTMIAQRLSDWWASMARVGGKTPWKKDYFTLTSGQQIYDLSQVSSNPYTPGTRRIHRIMWVAQPQILGPTWANDVMSGNLFSFGQHGLSYAGSQMSILGNAFDFILLAQSLETRNKILRSEFFYNISGDIVELTPMPGGMSLEVPANAKVFYYYFDEVDFLGLENQDEANSLIANPTNVQLDVVPYSTLNSPSKNWIDNYTVALAKYSFGSKLRMIKSIASPESGYQVEFDYQSLLEESKTEIEELKTNIREELEKLDTVKLMSDKTEVAENAAKINRFSPRKWFIGAILLFFIMF